ncbi:MAG: hypothetical protein QM539_10900 [Alphaproteobacteria bacterium]|nr:hypothetical protein [Alphaproteobacteria bacterium]
MKLGLKPRKTRKRKNEEIITENEGQKMLTLRDNELIENEEEERETIESDDFISDNGENYDYLFIYLFVFLLNKNDLVKL